MSDTPVLQIGVVVGDERQQLFRVQDIERLSDGGFAVANAGSAELKIFNADGSHRVTAGGPGDGPSEFRFPQAVVILPGDTIQVQNDVDRVLFTANGDFVRRETGSVQRLVDLAVSMGGRPGGGRWLRNGSYFVRVDDPEPAEWRPGPLFRPMSTFATLPSDFSSADTLGRYGGIEHQMVEVESVVQSVVPPFHKRTTWGATEDGSVIVGDNAHPQFIRYHPDGSRTIIRWAAPVETVTDHQVETWKDSQRAWRSEESYASYSRRWAGMDVPDEHPFFWEISTGSDGTVWVRLSEYRATESVFMAFDPDGIYRGTVTIPGWFIPYDSGPDWLAGVSFDDNDIERIQVYSLR